MKFGWSDFFTPTHVGEENKVLIPSRVICEERGVYQVQWTMKDSGWAAVSGKMQYQASGRKDFPAVGDWVLIEFQAGAERSIIHFICPRKSTIYRKQIGSSSDAQILSTNVDYTFITSSINEDLNQRRIERYLTMALDSGTSPVILLTKADLAEELDELLSEMESIFPGVPIYPLSKDSYAEADFFETYLRVGKTAVVVGSSGVGKSTLVNFLVGKDQGKDQIKTQDIRESDGKGRHTTTSRNLYISRFGGLVIDTPGMRELSLSDHEQGIETQFSDVVDLMSRCRFSDCRHSTEPGCAVKSALETKALSQDRWESYLKLEAEVRHVQRKQDRSLAMVEKKRWKKLTEEGRARGLAKRKT